MCRRFKLWCLNRSYTGFDFQSSEEEINSGIAGGKKGKPIYKKKVRYHDLMPGDIMLPTPTPVVKHTASDKSIFNVRYFVHLFFVLTLFYHHYVLCFTSLLICRYLLQTQKWQCPSACLSICYSFTLKSLSRINESLGRCHLSTEQVEHSCWYRHGFVSSFM